MTIGQEFAHELKLEAEVTRLYLTKVPFDHLDFQPSEKSETLGRLAVHVAEILAWWNAVIDANQLDFMDFKPKEFKSNEALLAYFDELLDEAYAALQRVQDDALNKDWSMCHGNEIYFTLPKRQVLRLFCMNHFIHHRAQLGVYLRCLEVSLPASYGPSADDFDVILTRKF